MKVIESYLPVAVDYTTRIYPLYLLVYSEGRPPGFISYGFFIVDIFRHYYCGKRCSYRICREV